MDQVSQQIADLASTLLPQLLVLDHPTIELLRAQYARARIASIEATGVGFFIRYDVPSDSPQTEPSHFAGGSSRSPGEDDGCHVASRYSISPST